MQEQEQNVDSIQDEQEIQQVQIDYSTYSKEELLEQLKGIQRNGNLLDEEDDIIQITKAYQTQFDEEKQEALDIFISENGSGQDFEYRLKGVDKMYFEILPAIQKRLKQLKSEEKETRIKNTEKKKWVLDELRQLVQNNEIKSDNFKVVKELQDTWRNAEPVSPKDKSELWSNYRALLNIFYTNHSILNDFRDLDRKKNLEEKTKLTEKAELLLNEVIIKNALSKYRDLADEFWSIGPVPDIDKDAIYSRFRSIRTKLEEKFKVVQEEYKQKMIDNLATRETLVQKIEPFIDFMSDRINDWKSKTDEIKKTQEEWRKASPVDKEAGKNASKSFWDQNKLFFNNKAAFFDTLEKEREENLVKKQGMIEKVKALKNSDEELSVKIDRVKKMQADWKKVGPAPRKVNDEIFQEFRSICNSFFDELTEVRKESEKEYDANFEKKIALCNKIDENYTDLDTVEKLIKEYSEVGFVPKDKIKETQDLFSAAIKKVFNEVTDKESDQYFRLKLYADIAKIGTHDKLDRELRKKQSGIKNKISHLQKDLDTLKLNMERFTTFGGNSLFQKEGETKVAEVEKEIADLRKRLKIIKELQ